jgi:hypothetical protein
VNSPAAALLWVVWGRVQWAIWVSAGLLAAAALLARAVNTSRRNLEALDREFQRLTQGSLSMRELASDSNDLRRASISFGEKTIWKGNLAPRDVISWRGMPRTPDIPFLPVVRMFLNDREIGQAQPQPGSAQLRVYVRGGPERSIGLEASVGCAERLIQAQRRFESINGVVLEASAVAVGLSLLILFGAFGMAEPDPVLGFTGLPSRFYLLPVPRWKLVAWPIALGFISMELLWLAWSGFVFGPLRWPGTNVLNFYYLGLLPVGLLLFQAIVWNTARFPITRVVLITFIVVGFGGMSSLPFWGAPRLAGGWASWGPTVKVGLPVLWPFCALLTLYGVSHYRQGEGMRRTRLASAAGSVSRERKARASARRTQYTLEWRRHGLPSLSLGLGAVWLCCFGLALVQAASPQVQVRNFVSIFFPCGLLLWAGLTGLGFARDPVSGRLSLSSFTALRPVSTAMLLEAKLLAAGGTWLLGSMLFGATWSIWRRKFGMPPVVLEDAVCLGLLSLSSIVGILPICLTGRAPGFPWSFLLLLAGGFGYWMLLQTWQGWAGFLAARYLRLAGVLVLLKVAAAILSAQHAWKAHWLSSTLALGYLAWWLLVSGFLVAWVTWGGWANIVEENGPSRFLPAAVLAVPLVRLALSPAALAANRHR